MAADRALPRTSTPLNYTGALRRVIADITRVVPAFRHIDPDRVLLSFSWARNRSRYGLYARTIALMEDGRKTTPDYYFRNRPVYYLIYFVLPRFHDLPFEEKMLTILHELYHISPAFDGALRVMGRRHHAHGRSIKEFDERLKPWVDLYIHKRGQEPFLEFLKVDAATLARRHHPITGLRVRVP